MEIIKTSTSDFDSTSANLVAQKIISLQKELNRPVNIVLATGRTMIGFLDQLSGINVDWSLVNFFHLDEYKGLSLDDHSSFAYFLTKNFFSKINIPQKNINFINGESPNLPSYIEKLHSFGGADIVMLGVGLDGHLAFNEPPLHSSFTSRIGEVRLNQSTIKTNQPDYPKIAQNPFAYTMGMADIFESKYIYFLAKGSSKSSIIFQSLQGEITPDIPASMLQLHPNVTAVLDFDAALLLK